MQNFTEIRTLEPQDIPAVVAMEYLAWHEYYAQYSIYPIIKDSVTKASLTERWQQFSATQNAKVADLVTGDDRLAYVAVANGKVVGVGAVSAYTPNVWPAIDQLLMQADGQLLKTAKLQNLYIHPDYRAQGIGRRLAIARADAMLAKGYQAVFVTTFAAASKTVAYHRSNGMQLVGEYDSMQTYLNNQKVKIACFLQQDLAAFRECLISKIS